MYITCLLISYGTLYPADTSNFVISTAAAASAGFGSILPVATLLTMVKITASTSP